MAHNVCVSAVVRFRSRVLSPKPNVERRYKLWATRHRTIAETSCWQLAPSRQLKVLLNLNFESIESTCLNGPSTISLLALCLTETNSVPNQLSSSRLKLLLDSKVVPLLVFSIILNPLFEKYSSVRFFAFSMSSVSVISSRNRLAPNVTPNEIVNGKIITLNHHKDEFISNAVQDVDK